MNKNINKNKSQNLEKRKNIAVVCIVATVLAVLSLWCWFKDSVNFSESERRALQAFPGLTWSSVASGDFMEDFETYTQDQFPMRDSFRSVKSMTNFYVLGKRDSNGLYIENGSVSKLDYPLQKPMLDHAAERFEYLYDEYVSGSDAKVYCSIVPDKNYFLAEANGYPSVDYEELIGYMRQKTDYMTYIDITDTLGIEDYYRTDTHWRQENLSETAARLAAAMGVAITAEYDVSVLDNPFYGVYRGQIALPLKADEIKYLTNEMLDACTVTSYDSGSPKVKPMYNMEKAYSRDPYEMFLGGADALLTIENPNAHSDRELVMFRDSFAGSLAPLLVPGYSKITMFDIRYIRSDMVGQFVTFDNQDVLFIYSTMMLNNSLALK